MSLVRLRPPLRLTLRPVALSRHSCTLSKRRTGRPAPRYHAHAVYSTLQTATTSTSTAPSPTTPPALTPAASLLAALLSHSPPTTLPGPLLHSAALLSAELRLLHRSLPFFVGFSSQLPSAGSHFTVECGGVSVVLIRGEDRVVRALFNNCTHQNARICPSSRPDLSLHALSSAATDPSAPTSRLPLQSAPTCHYAARLVCPFHHWTFGLDGQHLAPRTPLTRDPEQRKAFALRRAALEELDSVLWLRMKVETAANVAADEAGEEVAEARRQVQQRLAGRPHAGHGSMLLQHNWKHVLAALSQQPDTLTVFPSAVHTQQPVPLLLQLLPLSEQLTAVTAYGRETEAEVTAVADRDGGRENKEDEWKQWVEGGLAANGLQSPQGLHGEYGAQYHRLMVKGLRAEVEVEELKRREVEARRNKLLAST